MYYVYGSLAGCSVTSEYPGGFKQTVSADSCEEATRATIKLLPYALGAGLVLAVIAIAGNQPRPRR